MTTREFTLLTTSTDVQLDSVSELVDTLLPGHGAEGDPDADLVRRSQALGDRANTLQAMILADVGDAYDLSEDALTVLLHDRNAEVAVFERWESDLPLFLLATGYAPFTATPAPVGEAIIWLNPHTERTFLDSLSRVGASELFVADPDTLAGATG